MRMVRQALDHQVFEVPAFRDLQPRVHEECVGHPRESVQEGKHEAVRDQSRVQHVHVVWGSWISRRLTGS
jgi:hypothetical protein